MIPPPEELIAMLVLLGLVAGWLAWRVRDDFRRRDGRFDLWSGVEAYVSLFFMLCMLVASAAQVLVRYLLADTFDLPWTEEFGRLAMIWTAFWGAAALQRSDDHISMTVVYDLLPNAARQAVRVLGDLVTLAVLVPIVWLGWESARSLDVMHAISLGVPLSAFAYPVPLAGALMMLHTLTLIARRLSGRLPTQRSEPAV